MIGVTAVLVATMIAILCYNWISSTESVVWVVRGDESFDGAALRVEGLKDTDLLAPQELAFTRAHNFTIPLTLRRGFYHLSVHAGSRVLWRQIVVVDDDKPRLIDLTKLTKPGTQPSAPARSERDSIRAPAPNMPR
ncbi:MAG: hypothetical protein ACREIT_11165 [Tepidisphaeraceae bacterium]